MTRRIQPHGRAAFAVLSVMQRELAARALALLVVVGLHACNASEPAKDASGDAPAPATTPASVVPFVYHARLIFVRMQVGEHDDRLFLLDTGASASAIDARTAEELAIPIVGSSQVEGTAGTIDVRTARLASLSVGGARVEGLDVPCYDLGGLLAPEGERVDGILGHDFLGDVALHIDFAARTLVFERGGSSRPLDDAVVVPFEQDNGIPRIAAVLDDLDVELRLDTGASLFETEDVYVNIPQRVWAELCRNDPTLAPDHHLTGSGVGGTVSLAVARLDRLLVDDLAIERPYAIVQPEAGYFARPDAVGFVGNNLLEKYAPVLIDYTRNELHLTRPEPR